MRWYVIPAALTAATFAAGSARAIEVEIAAHGGALTRTQENDTLSSPGPVLGVAPLFRVSHAVAVGPLVEYARLNWSAAALGGSPSASADRLLLAGALRWYWLGGYAVDPYVQLAAGYMAHSPFPQAGGCSASMDIGAQLTGGLDATVASWARMGGSLTATGGVVSRGCLESENAPRVLIDPGLGLSSQVTFTALWESDL